MPRGRLGQHRYRFGWLLGVGLLLQVRTLGQLPTETAASHSADGITWAEPYSGPSHRLPGWPAPMRWALGR